MCAAHPLRLAPFVRFEKVEIPSMLHLGPGRVEHQEWVDHPACGGFWEVTVKLAAGGQHKSPSAKLRRV